MKITHILLFGAVAFSLIACNTSARDKTVAKAQNTDACGASKYQYLVGKPVADASKLKIPGDSRYYGANETIDPRKNYKRLNFVVNTKNVVDALALPGGKINRVFCG